MLSRASNCGRAGQKLPGKGWGELMESHDTTQRPEWPANNYVKLPAGAVAALADHLQGLKSQHGKRECVSMATALRTYEFLALSRTRKGRFEGYCQLTLESLADALSIHRRTAGRCLKALEAVGLARTEGSGNEGILVAVWPLGATTTIVGGATTIVAVGTTTVSLENRGGCDSSCHPIPITSLDVIDNDVVGHEKKQSGPEWFNRSVHADEMDWGEVRRAYQDHGLSEAQAESAYRAFEERCYPDAPDRLRVLNGFFAQEVKIIARGRKGNASASPGRNTAGHPAQAYIDAVYPDGIPGADAAACV